MGSNSMHHIYSFFAVTAKSMEDLLASELRSIGARTVQETRAGVFFEGTLEVAYRACLWSRIANKILLPIKTFHAATPEELYEGIGSIAWSDHLSVSSTLAVECNSTSSQITHTQFGALKVKDAIVDQFRSNTGRRPSVAVTRPDLQVNVYLHHDEATVNIDLSGESLHRRGYREEGVSATLKENLAAAMLMRARWQEIAAADGALVDPMCGSGTLPIEAALLAADIAPGIRRRYFGFMGWGGHAKDLWKQLVDEAHERRERGLKNLPPIIGYDADRRAVRAALVNVDRAGLTGKVHIERCDIKQAAPPKGATHGLVITDPPYGERQGDIGELRSLYQCLGEVLLEKFNGWKAAVLTGHEELARAICLRAVRVNTLYNGALECRFVQFSVAPDRIFKNVHRWKTESSSAPISQKPAIVHTRTEGAEMLANRLQKNLRNLGRWARQNKIYCYRLYDVDIPEYAVAIDIYERWAYVQEYAAPKTVDPDKARVRLEDVRVVVPEVLGIDPTQVFFRKRMQQKGHSQYQKQNATGFFQEVREDIFKFLVNFTDYIDTGLFLDHRLTRALIRKLAQGKRFLNLFSYTGTATVYAAGGGAPATITVDSSHTYLAWAQRNLALNGFAGKCHEFIRADCIEWLKQDKRKYGLIFLDPPTFSNAKDRQTIFDLQRDYINLVQLAAQRLDRAGVLIFSNNYRRFKMDLFALSPLNIEDITQQTIPRDFTRNPRIHKCWKITQN